MSSWDSGWLDLAPLKIVVAQRAGEMGSFDEVEQRVVDWVGVSLEGAFLRHCLLAGETSAEIDGRMARMRDEKRS